MASCSMCEREVFMKAQIYWSESSKLKLDAENASFFDEDYLYDVPEEVVEKWNELQKQNKEMQKILESIYKVKNP
jgi:hypothetical protein